MRVDHSEQTLRFRSLKKRDKTIYRDVPVPPMLLTTLNDVFGVNELSRKSDRESRMSLYGAGVALMRGDW